MDTILADRSISMSEFKRNPAAVLRQTENEPVAVLNHNRPAFYMLKPALFEALLEAVEDSALHAKVLDRLKRRADAIEVDIDTV